MDPRPVSGPRQVGQPDLQVNLEEERAIDIQLQLFELRDVLVRLDELDPDVAARPDRRPLMAALLRVRHNDGIYKGVCDHLEGLLKNATTLRGALRVLYDDARQARSHEIEAALASLEVETRKVRRLTQQLVGQISRAKYDLAELGKKEFEKLKLSLTSSPFLPDKEKAQVAALTQPGFSFGVSLFPDHLADKIVGETRLDRTLLKKAAAADRIASRYFTANPALVPPKKENPAQKLARYANPDGRGWTAAEEKLWTDARKASRKAAEGTEKSLRAALAKVEGARTRAKAGRTAELKRRRTMEGELHKGGPAELPSRRQLANEARVLVAQDKLADDAWIIRASATEQPGGVGKDWLASMQHEWAGRQAIYARMLRDKSLPRDARIKHVLDDVDQRFGRYYSKGAASVAAAFHLDPNERRIKCDTLTMLKLMGLRHLPLESGEALGVMRLNTEDPNRLHVEPVIWNRGTSEVTYLGAVPEEPGHIYKASAALWDLARESGGEGPNIEAMLLAPAPGSNAGDLVAPPHVRGAPLFFSGLPAAGLFRGSAPTFALQPPSVVQREALDSGGETEAESLTPLEQDLAQFVQEDEQGFRYMVHGPELAAFLRRASDDMDERAKELFDEGIDLVASPEPGLGADPTQPVRGAQSTVLLFRNEAAAARYFAASPAQRRQIETTALTQAVDHFMAADSREPWLETATDPDAFLRMSDQQHRTVANIEAVVDAWMHAGVSTLSGRQAQARAALAQLKVITDAIIRVAKPLTRPVILSAHARSDATTEAAVRAIKTHYRAVTLTRRLAKDVEDTFYYISAASVMYHERERFLSVEKSAAPAQRDDSRRHRLGRSQPMNDARDAPLHLRVDRLLETAMAWHGASPLRWVPASDYPHLDEVHTWLWSEAQVEKYASAIMALNKQPSGQQRVRALVDALWQKLAPWVRHTASAVPSPSTIIIRRMDTRDMSRNLLLLRRLFDAAQNDEALATLLKAGFDRWAAAHDLPPPLESTAQFIASFRAKVDAHRSAYETALQTVP